MREVDTIKSCQDKMRRHLEQVVVLNLFLNYAHILVVVAAVEVVVVVAVADAVVVVVSFIVVLNQFFNYSHIFVFLYYF